MPSATFNPRAPSVTVQVPVPTPVSSRATLPPRTSNIDMTQRAARQRLTNYLRPRSAPKPTAIIFPHGLEQESPKKFARPSRRRTPAPVPPQAPQSLHDRLIEGLSGRERQELEHPRTAETFH